MNVENKLDPSSEQVQELIQPGPEGPIYMVNLLKFKDRAEYADKRPTELSGHEAYMIYGRAVAELLPKFGGGLVFAGNVTSLLLGQVDELWDEVAIASYPDRAALIAMSSSPEWQEIGVHREAGLAGQLNIETVAIPQMLTSSTD